MRPVSIAHVHGQHAVSNFLWLAVISMHHQMLALGLKALRAHDLQRQPFMPIPMAAPAPMVMQAPAPAPFPAPAPGPQSWDNIFPGMPGAGGMFPGMGEDSSMPLGPRAPEFSVPQCGVETAGPMCFGNEDAGGMILPPALMSGLRGFWPFDDSVDDVSGLRNHGYGEVAPGPAFGGQGSSAFFRRSFLEVPDEAGSLRLESFSYTFWLYLIEDGAPTGLQICPIIRKGLGTSERFIGDAARTYDAAPAILYDSYSRRLRIEMLTVGAPGSMPGMSLLEAFESNARLRGGRWLHVALLRDDADKRTRLYVNGVLDASHVSKGGLKPVQEPLYVGGDPITRQACNLPMYIDELRVYSRVLDPDEIEAEAAPALGGVEPSFVRLACVDCPLELAHRLCPSDYHICSSLEMHMGGYQVAHSMGYLQPGTHVWTRSAVEAARQRRRAEEARQLRRAKQAQREQQRKEVVTNASAAAEEHAQQAAQGAEGAEGAAVEPEASRTFNGVPPGAAGAAGGAGAYGDASGGFATGGPEGTAAGREGFAAGGSDGYTSGATAGSDGWKDEVRATVVSLVEQHAAPTQLETAGVALAIPDLGLGLCCADS